MAIPSQGQIRTKTCTNCRAIKSVSEFYNKSQNRGDGVAAECKVCTRKRSQQWREERCTPAHKARWNEYLRDRRARIRDAAFAAYGGNRCVCCGETTREFLTLDHIKNDGAQFRRLHFSKKSQSHGAGYWTYAWVVKHNFPPGFQVLCMNCNYGKRMNHGTCPHLTRCNDQAKAVEPSGSKRSTPTNIKLVG